MTLTDTILSTQGPAEPPFSPEPQPQFLYLDAVRRRILADLLAHVCDGGGPLFLVAENGLGKTMLLDRLASEAIAHDVRVRLARCSAATDGLAPGPAIEGWLARTDGPAALLLDDADALPLHLWRQLLTALQTPSTAGELGPLVLAVTPGLYDWLSGPAAGFAGCNLGPVFRLPPLAAADVGRYLRFRLRVAGCDRADLFADAAIRRIADVTGGVPLAINRLAAEALASLAGDATVTVGLVDRALAAIDPQALAAATPVAAEPSPTSRPLEDRPGVSANRVGSDLPDAGTFIGPIGEPSYADVALAGEAAGWRPLPGKPVLTAESYARRRRRPRLRLPRWAVAGIAAAVTAVVGVGLLGYRADPDGAADTAVAPSSVVPGEPASPPLPSTETAGLSAFTLARPTDPAGPAVTPPPLLDVRPSVDPAPLATQALPAGTDGPPPLAMAAPRQPLPAETTAPASRLEPGGGMSNPPPAEGARPETARSESTKPETARPEATRPVAAKSLSAPVARNGNRTEPPRAGEANGTSRRGAVTPIRTTPAPAEASTDRGNDSVAVEEDPTAETSGGEMDPAADQEPVRPRPVREIIAMGDEFREAGDVEWARRLYRAAKERGSGKAATALAETYDPLYTAASSRASAEEARHLYETAVKLGDRSATRRLQDLEAWEEERPVER